MSALDELRHQVDAARDQAMTRSAEMVEAFDGWRQLAERLFILETGAGIQPIWRGPQPREAFRPRVVR